MQLTACTAVPVAATWSRISCSRLPPLFFSRHQNSLKSTVPSLLPTVRGFRSSKLSAAEVQEEAAVTKTEQLDWSKHWYPIILEKEVVTTTPYPFELLGRDLLLWKDKDGEWSCLEDRCPHRQAALSKGRFSRKDGSLMCSFHGWSFDSKGKCVNIPQATTEKQAMILTGKKAHVQSFPIRIRNGLIWVWPDDAPSAWIEASATPIDMPEHLQDSELTNFGVGEKPLDWINCLEMAFDPGHAPFAHEGVTSAYTEENAIPFDLSMQDFGPSGFTVKVPQYTGTPGDLGTKSFIPPILSISDYKFGKSKVAILIFNVPAKPGKTRFVTCVFSSLAASSLAVSNLQKLQNLLKAGVKSVENCIPEHWRTARLHVKITTEPLGRQDDYLLVEIEDAGRLYGNDANSQNYLPTSSDLGISSFRKWLNKFGGRGVGWCLDPEPVGRVTVEEMHDIWSRHTKHCKACRQSVKDFIAIREGLRRVVWVCLAMTLGMLLVPERYVPLKISMLGLVFTGGCMLVREWLGRIISSHFTGLKPGHQPGNVDLLWREATA